MLVQVLKMLDDSLTYLSENWVHGAMSEMSSPSSLLATPSDTKHHFICEGAQGI